MGALVEVAAGIVVREGQILITQRRPSDHLGGLWEFPGGKREAGETFQACLVRELREELGIEVRVGPLFETITHHYPDKSVLLHFFTCFLLAGEPAPLACQSLAWVTVAQLDDYAFPAADARLLRKLREGLGT